MADAATPATTPPTDSALERYRARRRSTSPVMAGLRRWWPAAVVMAVIVTIWELFLVVTGMPPFVLPPLSAILAVGYNEWSTIFWPNAQVTLIVIIVGFIVSLSFGFAVATAVHYSDIVNRSFMPFIVASQAIPSLAITPILIIWFGFGIAPKLIVIVLICFFPVVMNTLAGYKSVERDALNLMDSLGASPAQTYWKVRLPAALPNIFVGVRLCAVSSPIGAFVGEFFGADMGIAPLIISMSSGFQTATMMFAVILLAFMAIVLFGLVVLAERLLIPWYFIARERTKAD